MKKIINNKILLHSLSGALSFLITLGCFAFFNIPKPFSELMFVVMLAGIMFLMETAFKVGTKPIAVTSGIFSAVVALTVVIGNKIIFWGEPYYYPYTKLDILYWAAIGLALFFILTDLLYVVQKYAIKVEFVSKKAGLKSWLMLFGILVVCWLPYYILFYPANLTPDSSDSIAQAIGAAAYSNHCPILYTLFVKVCIKFGMLFGDLRFGVGCFAVVQMLIMAAILSYSVYWLAKRNLPKYVVVLATLFYALNPVIAMYAITMWKDILFSGWMLLLTLMLFDIIESGGKLLAKPWGLTAFSLCCLLVAFGRNNGIYAVVAVLIALGIYCRKQLKVLAPVFVSIVAVVGIIQGPVYSAAGIQKSEFAESVGIPIQQIGFTVKSNGRMTAEQEEFINQLLPIEKIKESYNPESPDNIKFHSDFNNQFLENNKGKFLKVWAEMLIPNFKSYVKAYLMQTIGYWHVGTTNWVCQFGIDENRFGIQSVQHAWMQNKIKTAVKGIYYIPVVRDFFSISFMVWTTFFCCAVLILKKQAKYIMAFAPLLAVWATMMIAVPTFCEFRYMYSFHLILPFALISLFLIRKKGSSRPGQSAARHDGIRMGENDESKLRSAGTE